LALSVHDKDYFRNASCTLNLISAFYYYHWINTFGCELLVPEGISCTIVSASLLTCACTCW